MADKKSKSTVLNLKNALHRNRLVILSLIICFLGLALIIFPESFFEINISSNIGSSLLVAGTVGLGLEYFSRNQIKDILGQSLDNAIEDSIIPKKLDNISSLLSLGKEFSNLGVKRFYSNRNDINLVDQIKNAKPQSEIMLLGICLRGLVGANAQNILQQKLKEECKIRMLVLHPESQFVRFRGKEEQRAYDEIKRDVDATISLHETFQKSKINEKEKERIEMRYYDSAPNYFMLFTSEKVIVGFYLRDNLGEFFPQIELEFKKDGISKPFLDHYESLWREALQQKEKEKEKKKLNRIQIPSHLENGKMLIQE